MRYDDFTVVLPTLNEGANMEPLLQYLTRNYEGINVLVVDDGSTDGTREIAGRFSKEHVRLLDRHRLHLAGGLTNSIADGIAKSRTRYVIVMDADFQHPPEVVRSISHRLGTGYELVVAYRMSVEDWPLFRKLISKILIYVGYLVLFAGRRQGCRDIFSGFFGIRREIFMKVYSKNRKRFVGRGYKVLFDFLKCVGSGTISLYEVPFTFVGRKEGRSKAGVGQGLALFRSFMS